MSLLPPSVLRRLARSRIGTREARASIGIGERASRAKGVGIEFADHRSYQMGDDTRHLDPHLHARLGGYYVREFSLYQQLPVVVLVDTSRSMAFGSPAKLPFAASLAAALGYITLAGGDRLQVGGISGGEIHWSPSLGGISRAPDLFSWLERLRPAGDTRVDEALKRALPRLRREGLLVVISDWLFDGAEEALATLAAARQELVGVQVLGPEEIDPSKLGSGLLRLVDAETGSEVEVGLDDAAISQYRAELGEWIGSLREQHARRRWLFVETRSDDDLERLLTLDWRRLGIIG